MTKKRWAAKDKSRIVMESLTAATPVADICKKYGLSPNTFYPWREKFIEAGKTALAGGNNGHTAALQKENDSLKLLLGEYTLANNALKKTLEARKR